jgi:hypothetical protein
MEIKRPSIAIPSITPLMVSPDAVGPFVAPFQQETVTEKTLLSLFLTAVRVIIERGDCGRSKYSQQVSISQVKNGPSPS